MAHRKEPVRIGLSNDRVGPQEALWLRGAWICSGCKYHHAELDGLHACGWPRYKRPRGMGTSPVVPEWCPALEAEAQGQDAAKVAQGIEDEQA